MNQETQTLAQKLADLDTKKSVKLKWLLSYDLEGVGGPGNLKALLNRFPPHDQLLAILRNARFVTISASNLVGAFHHHARLFRLQVVLRHKMVSGIRGFNLGCS